MIINLAILILSWLQLSRASILTEALELIPGSNEKFEILAETLDWALIHSSENERESIFSSVISSFAKLGEIPDNELYEVVMKVLCNNLNKISLNIIIKSTSNDLTPSQRADFIEKLRIICREEEYFKEKRLNNFEYPEKTLRIIFSTLQLIDPNSHESFDIILSFIKYYKTDEYLKLALPLVLKGIESRLEPLPIIKFNLCQL